jgi:sec-independent protein translocase protein TatA
MIGSQDLVVGLVIVLVLFGAKRLPELAGSIGKSMKEFKKGVAEVGEKEQVDPPSLTAASGTVPKSCLGCTSPLQPEWSHCPRCGTAVPNSSPPGPPNPA